MQENMCRSIVIIFTYFIRSLRLEFCSFIYFCRYIILRVYYLFL